MFFLCTIFGDMGDSLAGPVVLSRGPLRKAPASVAMGGADKMGCVCANCEYIEIATQFVYIL